MSEPNFELCKLECIVGGLKKPGRLGLAQLKAITDEFSDARKIGQGGCGAVYKGILGNRTVAVKRLFNDHTIDDEMFKSEVRSMMMVNHKNIIQFLGFCSDTQQAVITMGDKLIFPEIRERLLCFEYIKSGSLTLHIKDEFRGLNWHERYQIIEGICEGLHYLHKEMPINIIHMDLKPDNILLGDNMVPKITDFGLARLTDKSKTTSEKCLISLGYCAPEYLYDRKMSLKSDIYSLGVIIQELVTGSKVDPNPNIKKVLQRWRNRWNKSSRNTPLLWYRQVTKCLDLAQWCKRRNPTCRPYIWDIISELKEIDKWNGETKYATVSSVDELTLNLEDMLGIEPLDMHIPFALKEHIPSIKVTNDTDDHFALRIATPSPLLFGTQPEEACIVPPQSQICVTITLKAPDMALLQNHCYDFSVQSSRIDGIPTSMDVTRDMFDDKVGKMVDEVNVRIIFDMARTSEQQPPTYIDNIKCQEADKASGETLLRADREPLRLSYQGYKGSEAMTPTVPDDSRNMQMANATLAITKISAVLGDKGLTKLSEKVPNLRTLPVILDIVRKDLGMLCNVIQHLDSASLTRELVQEWVCELRRVAYQVEDLMDKYPYHSVLLMENGSFTRFLKGADHAKAFIDDFADEVVQIMNEIQKLKELQSAWLPFVEFVPKYHVSFDQQRSQGFFPEQDLVGMKENQCKLVECLDSSQPNNNVITVSGMGGLGKSTLVATVFDRMKNSFGVNAWLSISQTYTIDGLLRELLWKIGYTENPLSISFEKMDIYMLKQEIKSRLQDSGKCLVVFDDVWDKEMYENMQDVFKNLQSSRVIITTRKDDVASLASSGNHIQLQPLDKDDALHLFYARAFNNTADRMCPPALENVAAKIVERCQGLPLALVSMGSLMSTKPKTEHAWNLVLKQFQSVLSKKDDVQAILNLCYNDLPGNLRNCFLYCSLFPNDYTISRESLIRQWVAEGFAVATEDSTMEDVAELNLMELINRNMLQVVDYDELGRVGTCTMHDIVRDLALSIAKMEKFGSANHRGAMLLMDKEVRRLSSYGWKDNDSMTEGFPYLRTLMSFGAITSTPQMLASIFACSCYLTVLELQDSAISEIPRSIQNLFNLRYIGLRRTRIKSLPECIEKLSNLQTLDMKQTKIEKLPRGIVKVKKLRHLLADRDVDKKLRSFQYFHGVKPPKDLSNLVELQTLETLEASDDLADQLEKMNKLQSVWISNINATHSAKLFASLSKMPLLSSLLLNACDDYQALSLESFNPEPSTQTQLHRLIVRGRWAAGMLECPIFQGHGRNLRYLALSWSGLVEDPLLLLASHVPNLAYLSLNRASTADTLVVSDGSFPKLRTFVLKNLQNVNQITIGKDALQNIQDLYVVTLPRLDKVPQGIESLTSLKRLWMLQLHGDFKVQWGENGMNKKMVHVLELKI